MEYKAEAMSAKYQSRLQNGLEFAQSLIILFRKFGAGCSFNNCAAEQALSLVLCLATGFKVFVSFKSVTIVFNEMEIGEPSLVISEANIIMATTKGSVPFMLLWDRLMHSLHIDTRFAEYRFAQ